MWIKPLIIRIVYFLRYFLWNSDLLINFELTRFKKIWRPGGARPLPSSGFDHGHSALSRKAQRISKFCSMKKIFVHSLFQHSQENPLGKVHSSVSANLQLTATIHRECPFPCPTECNFLGITSREKPSPINRIQSVLLHTQTWLVCRTSVYL